MTLFDRRHVGLELLGRQDEVAHLHGAVAALVAGAGTSWLVEGPRGTGRTSLLDATAKAADGVSVLTVAVQPSPGRPLAPFMEMVGPLLPSTGRTRNPLGRLLMADWSRSAAVDVAAAAEAVAELLERHCASVPVLCLVDDGDRLEPEAKDVLTRIAQWLGGGLTTFITSCTPTPTTRAGAPGLPAATRLEIGPLDGHACEALLARVDVAPTVAWRLHDEFGGRPGMLLAVARSLSPGQRRGDDPIPYPAGGKGGWALGHAERQAFRTYEDPVLADQLTERERSVVDLVARGLGNREIGEHLYLSVKTVEMHLSHVYRKLDIRSRVQLVALYPAGAVR